MTSTNDITGDRLATKIPSKKFLDNYDLIFRKGKEPEPEVDPTIAELNRLVVYYQNLSDNSEDLEMHHFYRGSAAALNLFASWLERA